MTSLSWLKSKVREKLAKFYRFFPHYYISPYRSQYIPVHAAQWSWKWCNQWVWNKILNIKSCMGQISGTWILKKKYDYKWKILTYKRLIGLLKLCIFGRNRAISLKPGQKKSPTLPGLVCPVAFKEKLFINMLNQSILHH